VVCEFRRKFDINSLYICPPYLYTVATLPWEIQNTLQLMLRNYDVSITFRITQKLVNWGTIKLFRLGLVTIKIILIVNFSKINN